MADATATKKVSQGREQATSRTEALDRPALPAAVPPPAPSRFSYQTNECTSQDLERIAEAMDLSKVKALQVAVQILAKISDEMNEGAELYLKRNGKRTRLWLPFFRNK